jgi:hypothetical protein
VLLEGLADTPDDAERALREGRAADGTPITLEPCHHHRTVGPMAGVVTPSMWVFVLRDPVHGGTAYCSLNEGLGKVLRYGAYGPEVLDRLVMSGYSGRCACGGAAAGQATGPVDVPRHRRADAALGDERSQAATAPAR